MESINPYVRFITKTNYFIPNKKLIANDCRILYIINGTIEFTANEKKYILNPHSLIYYPYETPYSICGLSEDVLFYTVNFDITQLYSDVKTVLIPKSFDKYNPEHILKSVPKELEPIFLKSIYLQNSANLENYFADMYKENVNRLLNWSDIQNKLMGIILNKIHRRIETPKTSNPICDKIKEIVKEELHNISNLSISKKLGYHPNYLNTLFLKNEGITIHQYVLQKRLTKAYELIGSTEMSYEKIAELCAFSSTAHLATAIKKKYNLTPSQIRKQL